MAATKASSENLKVEMKSGGWTVRGLSEESANNKKFASKAEAVSIARRNAKGAKTIVVIKTAAGQIIRPPTVKASLKSIQFQNAIKKFLAAKAESHMKPKTVELKTASTRGKKIKASQLKSTGLHISRTK